MKIPRIVLLPLGLMLLILSQYALGKTPYFSQALVGSLYLLWVGLLVVLGRRLRDELGLSALVAVLAVFLLLGSELSALIGFAQYYDWRNLVFDRLVSVKTGLAVFGNTGQPNHFADYIVLGLISLGLLRMRWQLRAWQAALLAVPLLFVLVLSGSRSAWLYLLCLAAMAFVWQRRDKTCRPLLHYSLALVLGFGLMHFVVQIPWLAGHSGSVDTVSRLVDEVNSVTATAAGGGVADRPHVPIAAGGGSVAIRLHVWREAWLIFTQFPLLGAGFGQFSWQHFLLGPSLHNINITGIYNNAHNIVLQTAAEMGVAGLAILFGTLALWLRQVRRAQLDIYHWWGYSLFAVLAIHSLLEYPLWYSHFLGVLALLLGMLDNTSYSLKSYRAGRVAAAAILLSGALLLSQMWQGYRKLELVATPAPIQANEYARRVNWERLMEIQGAGKMLLKPYVDLGLGELGWDHIADNRVLNENVMHFMPIRSVVYRESMLLARSGLHAEARVQMERAIWAYPSDFPSVFDTLRQLAEMDADPARYPALLAFALQKYEERQRAAGVH